jgi:alpha-maltose-1-phosphate synthase
MAVLFGHSVGNPNSYHVAQAYFEAGLLDRFCVPWMPSSKTISVFSAIKPFRSLAQRLARRHFPPLLNAPKVQDRMGELFRLLMRTLGVSGTDYYDINNQWLMRTMARECYRPNVSIVHAYEDCSLLSFREAKRLGKACVYDLPTSYFPAWERIRGSLNKTYSDWFPMSDLSASHQRRLAQKREELELADLTFVASRYVEATVRDFYPHKNVVRAPYGVDLNFWTPSSEDKADSPVRFIYAGQLSPRKGVPLLIEAWLKADLQDAELVLVGTWGLADNKRRCLPSRVTWIPPCSAQSLRELYRHCHVFVFPTYSDGFGLVLLEAMACGLPTIASEASIGPEIITPKCGRLMSPGDLDQLVDHLRWAVANRDQLPLMGGAARAKASCHTWDDYRSLVAGTVGKLM